MATKAVLGQERVELLAIGVVVVLDGDGAHVPPVEVKGRQDLQLRTFGVDRHVVDDLRRALLHQQVVEADGLHLEFVLGTRRRPELERDGGEVGVFGGLGADELQLFAGAGIDALARDRTAAVGGEGVGEAGIGFGENAAPAHLLLQQPGVAEVDAAGRAEFDEIAALLLPRHPQRPEVLEQLPLRLTRHRSHEGEQLQRIVLVVAGLAQMVQQRQDPQSNPGRRVEMARKGGLNRSLHRSLLHPGSPRSCTSTGGEAAMVRPPFSILGRNTANKPSAGRNAQSR